MAPNMSVLRPPTAALPSVTPSDGPNDGPSDEPGEALQEWSSLIGIVTAIVGNILIAMALNVQRYAHTRLHKQRIRVKQKARAAMRRAKSGSQARPYGTIAGEGHQDGSESRRGHGHGSPTAGAALSGGRISETEPLTASFHSGATSDTQVADGADDDDDDAAPSKVASTYLKSPYWWLGQVLITVGEMGNFLAYGFAPASIVSPLGVVALISNCVIAPVMFHEKFRQRDFWGVVVAIAGVITVVLSANQEETKLNPHAVWDAITTLEFEVYLAVTMALIVLLMWASTQYGKRTILIDLGLVGLFGGYTVLATKGVSSMLSSTLWRAFTTPVMYVLVLILLLTAVMQIRYVNKALQRFDSTQVIPIQFVLFTLCVILGSAVLYRDFEETTAEQAGKFVGGCLLTFFGVFLITSGRQKDHEDDEDLLSEAEGVEETIGLEQQEGNPAQQGRDTGQDTVPRSRRSSRMSRVSFASTVKPGSPPRGVGANDTSLMHTDSESSEDSLMRGSAPPSLSNHALNSMPVVAPPRGIRTISADSVVLSGRPDTSNREQSTPLLATHETSRPPLGHSRSPSYHGRGGTFINPSPLSSTVTTVVKDGFLRDRDDALAKKSSLRRIRSTIRAGLFLNEGADDYFKPAAAGPRSAENLSHAPNAEAAWPESTPEEGAARSRSRSVSDAIGDFFRPKGIKKEGSTSEDAAGGRPASRDGASSGDC